MAKLFVSMAAMDLEKYYLDKNRIEFRSRANYGAYNRT
jgi:hypothetical protein